MVCDTDEDLSQEIEHIKLLVSNGIDGLVIMPVGQKYDHFEFLLKRDIPFVLVDRCFDELNASSVVVDNYKGAYWAVEHLCNMGHSRVAMIQGLQNTYTNNKRVQGYRDALRQYGIDIDENLIVGKDFRKESGYIETKFLLNMVERPTAIFATSDLITLGVLQAISEENLCVPDDISLVAFDDIDFAPFLVAPLTTVTQPRELMGEIAVKLLVEQMSKPENKEVKRIVLNPKLVIRNSVKMLASNKRVAAGASSRVL